MKTRKKPLLIALALLVTLLAAGFAVPERITIPVSGASKRDWHPDSFWYEPWGTSGVHKGIDIFAKSGTPVVSTTAGLILYQGALSKGGKVVLVLGPKWRLHYYAHLNTIGVAMFDAVGSGEAIGTVGDTGNAKGKPPHLHYSILRLLPAPWAIDGATQGYKKAFFVDPARYLAQ